MEERRERNNGVRRGSELKIAETPRPSRPVKAPAEAASALDPAAGFRSAVLAFSEMFSPLPTLLPVGAAGGWKRRPAFESCSCQQHVNLQCKYQLFNFLGYGPYAY